MASGDLKSVDLDTFQADSRRKKFALGHEWNACAPCLKCGPEKCEGGLDLHFWRKICKTCKCKPEEHDIKSAEEEAHKQVVHSLFSKDSPVGHIRDYFRKCEEAKNTKQSGYVKQFTWCPPGLQENVLMKYMEALPTQVKPKVGSDGAKYRRKQMMYQLPIHDHDENYCDNLNEPERASMRQFCEDRNQNALGVGDVREKTNPVSKWVCCRCDNNINLGEVAVFTFHGGETKCWHPGCFVCQVCNNVLVDLIYFYKDGGIYCGRHYAEMFKPRCAACDELIFDGEYTQAMDKNWHQNHFCCFYCDEALSQQKFVTVDGKPTCSKCYDKNFANSCENCGRAISFGTKDVDVRGKHWHSECFVCSQTDCKKPLVNQEFSVDDNKLICLHCSNNTASKVCETCGGNFGPGEEKLLYQAKAYHENCFICDKCKEPLGTQEFIRRDDKRLCGKCNDTGCAKICVKCNEPIKSSVIVHDGNTYHSDCITCTMCCLSLAGTVFYTHEGNNICSDCYHDNYAKRCATCQQLIEGSVCVTYCEKFFHRDCFMCTKCDVVLDVEKFFLVGNDKVCSSCSSLILT